MTDKEKAELILEHLDNVLQVNWNLKDCYLKAIIKALHEIRKEVQR